MWSVYEDASEEVCGVYMRVLQSKCVSIYESASE